MRPDRGTRRGTRWTGWPSSGAGSTYWPPTRTPKWSGPTVVPERGTGRDSRSPPHQHLAQWAVAREEPAVVRDRDPHGPRHRTREGDRPRAGGADDRPRAGRVLEATVAGAPCAHRTLERLGHAGRDRRRQAGQGRSWGRGGQEQGGRGRERSQERVGETSAHGASSGRRGRAAAAARRRLSGGRGVSRTRHSWRVRAALPRRGGPEVDRRAHGQAHRNGSAGARGGDSGRIGRGAAVGSAAVAPRRWRGAGPAAPGGQARGWVWP